MEDSTLGWRFVNPEMERAYPPISLGETAEEVAERWSVSRERQDAFALESQRRAVAAIEAGRFASPARAGDGDRAQGRRSRWSIATSIRDRTPPPRRWRRFVQRSARVAA